MNGFDELMAETYKAKDARVHTVRALLLPDDTRWDYYRGMQAAAVKSWLPVYQALQMDSSLASPPSTLPVPEISDDVLFVPDTSYPSYTSVRKAYEYPVQFDYTFTRQDATHLAVTYQGEHRRLPVRYYNNILSVSWPAWFDVQCGVQVRTAWTDGFSFTYSAEPCGYPYGQALSKLEQLPETALLLDETGLRRAYDGAWNSMRKIGLITLALAKTEGLA